MQSEVKYFTVEYEFNSRPLWKLGKYLHATETFAATDQSDAYRQARAEGVKRYKRCVWRILACAERTAS